MDRRLTKAEEEIAHLARVVEDLSAVIARQESDIARLTRRVAQLVEREAEREMETGETAPDNAPPPHW